MQDSPLKSHIHQQYQRFQPGLPHLSQEEPTLHPLIHKISIQLPGQQII